MQPPTLRLQAPSSREAISSSEGLAGPRRDSLDERNPCALRLRQPLEAAPPTPGPDDWEEEEEEFLWRDEPRDSRSVQATSSSSWAFRRLGLLAPPDRDAELRAGRLEGATWPGSRGRLRLRGHPPEVLLQWYLTLRRSDAMGTCKVKRARIPPPLLLAARPQTPATPGPLGGDGRARRSEPGAGLTDLSPFFPLPITVLKVSEMPKRFDCLRSQSASEKSQRPQWVCQGLRSGFHAHSPLPRSPSTALLPRCQSASGTTKRFHRVCNTKPFRDARALRGTARRLTGRTWRPQARAAPARRPAAPAAPPPRPGRKGPESPLRARPPSGRCRRGPDGGSAPPAARPPARRPPQSLSPGPASARTPTTLASAAPASRNQPCGPQPSVRQGRALRRTEGAHCSNRPGAGPRARRSSPIGQEAWRRDPTPYEARPLVGSWAGRLTWARRARSRGRAAVPRAAGCAGAGPLADPGPRGPLPAAQRCPPSLDAFSSG